jgi:hypothetical protein
VGPTRGAAAAATTHAARSERGGGARGAGRGWAAGEGGLGWAARWPAQDGMGRAGGKGGGGPKGREKRAVAGPNGERERFPFLFYSYFPIIYFISNLLLNAYFVETKQIYTKGNRCVAQHDATTKENISRVHLHKVSS